MKDDGPEESNNCRPRIRDLKRMIKRTSMVQSILAGTKGKYGSDFRISGSCKEARKELFCLCQINGKRRAIMKPSRRKRHFCSDRKKNLTAGLLNGK